MKTNSSLKPEAFLNERIEEAQRVKQEFFGRESGKLIEVAKLMGDTVGRGGKILICGNGGSAADAQHFSGELVGRFIKERRPLPAIALSTDTSTLTAIGNDYGYDQVFSRQVEALGSRGDLFFAISTSGNSPNVLRAVASAKERGMTIVGLTGNQGGTLGKESDFHINVALGKNSPRIQEVHIMVIHLLVDLLDEYYLTTSP